MFPVLLAVRIKLFGEEHETDESTAYSYDSLGVTQQAMMHNYKAALQSHQRALARRNKMFGEKHKSTADSYDSLGTTQHAMHDYIAALQSDWGAVAVRILKTVWRRTSKHC